VCVGQAVGGAGCGDLGAASGVRSLYSLAMGRSRELTTGGPAVKEDEGHLVSDFHRKEGTIQGLVFAPEMRLASKVRSRSQVNQNLRAKWRRCGAKKP